MKIVEVYKNLTRVKMAKRRKYRKGKRNLENFIKQIELTVEKNNAYVIHL